MHVAHGPKIGLGALRVNQEPEEAMKEEYIEGKQVMSDGRTVWVNDTICLARFCGTSYEIANGVEELDIYEGGAGGRTTPTDWTKFKILVKKAHGILVPDEHKPNHLKETT